MDLAAVIRLVERFRASGELFTDGGVFRFCWDAALDAGFILSITRNRTVPVKKSNPGLRYPREGRPVSARRRYIDRGKDTEASRRRLAGLAGMVLPRASAFVQADRPIGQSFQSPIEIGVQPEAGFTYAGNNRELIRGENASLFGIDAETVDPWTAQRVDQRPMRVGAADLTFDDHDRHLEQHRLVLASNPTRPVELRLWYGQRWLGTSAGLWDSDRIFVEIHEEEAEDLRDAWALREAINAPPRTLAGAQAMVDEMVEQGLITSPEALMVTHVDQHTRSITLARRPRPRPDIVVVSDDRVRAGEAFLIPSAGRYAFEAGRRSGKSELVRQLVGERAVHVQNIGASAPESRVPAFLQSTTRLDGRKKR